MLLEHPYYRLADWVRRLRSPHSTIIPGGSADTRKNLRSRSPFVNSAPSNRHFQLHSTSIGNLFLQDRPSSHYIIFQQAIFGCKRGLRVVREWSLLADHSKIDQAQRYFSDQFENIRELRQTVLHSSEIFGSKDRLSENSVSDRADELFKIEGVGFGLIGGNFFGAKYSACFGGKTYYLELTEEKVRILNDITADVFSALEGVFRTMQPASSG